MKRAGSSAVERGNRNAEVVGSNPIRSTIMRLWSLHPNHLDNKGLVALWREGLLAKKVLANQTKGYKNYPQLLRFKNFKNP